MTNHPHNHSTPRCTNVNEIYPIGKALKLEQQLLYNFEGNPKNVGELILNQINGK